MRRSPCVGHNDAIDRMRAVETGTNLGLTLENRNLGQTRFPRGTYVPRSVAGDQNTIARTGVPAASTNTSLPGADTLERTRAIATGLALPKDIADEVIAPTADEPAASAKTRAPGEGIASPVIRKLRSSRL